MEKTLEQRVAELEKEVAELREAVQPTNESIRIFQAGSGHPGSNNIVMRKKLSIIGEVVNICPEK
ncbi:MAG: hypothetical protein PWP71_2458 [Clostridia bacterium]|nr:hypothetical protein [Clostridia bacterium]